jgi:exonuclease III
MPEIVEKNDEVSEAVISLDIIGKNVQSLQTELREEEFMAELRTIKWDVVLLNETWREKKQERWRTEDGHIFCGAGGKKGEQGVAILLHHRWANGFHTFHAISERICAIDVNMDGNLLRYIAIYMPHGGQDDADVEGVYSELGDLVCGARRVNRICILLGNWNAVVDPYHLGDDENIVGPYGGIGIRNGRGEWLVEWASSQRLTIADTLFEKHFDDQWTYQNGLTKRQLDYCLIDVGHAQETLDAGAAELIGVGMDHRTIKLRLALRSSVQRHGRRKRGRRQTRSMRGWRPISDGVY